MKNKFLIFSLLFIFASGLLIYLHPQISFATISSVTTDTPSVGKTSVTLNGTANLDGVNELHDRRGFNLGTTTANRGNYSMGSSTDTSGAGTGSFNHATTSLSKGTAYYFRAYAASSTVPQSVYGSESSFLTGIDDPASLAANSATQESISFSWTAGTGAGKTHVRYGTTAYPASITDGTQGCATADSSCSVVPLACGTSFYFRAWSSTTAANTGLSTSSISYTELTTATGRCAATLSSGGGTSRKAPTTYSDSLVINAGAATAKSREVTLILRAGNANLMTICNRSDLLNCSLENYTVDKSWTLTEGDGVKTVYAKFLSSDGLNSDTVSDTIILDTSVLTPTPISVPVSTPVSEPTPTPISPPTPTPTPAPAAEKPISEMSKEELAAKIAEIMNQIKELQGQATELKFGKITGCIISTFNRNLRRGVSGDDVKCLQIILNSDPDTKIAESGDGSPGNETNFFGFLTRAAVIKFQEKYASKVLTPSGLKNGTGLVYPATRAKLNELLGR